MANKYLHRHVFGKYQCGFIGEEWAFVHYLYLPQWFVMFPPNCGDEYALIPDEED